MLEWLLGAAYYAHGYCLSWNPWLIASQAGADFIIFASYTAIPIAILIFLRRRPGAQLKGLGRFFAAFIFWCGLTHLVETITLWFPIYEFQAGVKIVTAGISLTTALLIFELIPKALAIPSPSELQTANARLRAEIAAHEITLAELRSARDQLEQKVRERTKSLEESATHAESLVREIAHRSGNLMSVIAAMARQSAGSANTPRQMAEQLAGRIDGMGRSQALLLRKSWKDVDFEELVREQISPFVGDREVILGGPRMLVSPQAAHVLGMAFHELATNSLRFGALSVAGGLVAVNWGTDAATDDTAIWVKWREEGGPEVQVPKKRGWGAKVLSQMTALPLGGETYLDYAPGGLVWSLRVPANSGALSLTRT